MQSAADRLLEKADDYRALAEEHPEQRAYYAVIELVLREVAAALDDQALEEAA